MKKEKWNACILHRFSLGMYLSYLEHGTKKNKFHWEPVHQQAFEKMKQLFACNIVLAYLDFELPTEINTDTSDYQLGAMIVQNNRPIASFSKKLNGMQWRYTVTKK